MQEKTKNVDCMAQVVIYLPTGKKPWVQSWVSFFKMPENTSCKTVPPNPKTTQTTTIKSLNYQLFPLFQLPLLLQGL
jgi:hypothetical protein